jgi:hypothetical protein
MFKPLILHFWRLCRFRAGPQDTPHSTGLLLIILLINLGLALSFLLFPQNKNEISEIEQQLPALTVSYALKSYAVIIGGTSLYVSLLLYSFGYRNRIVQTLTSLFGVEAMLGILVLIIAIILRLIPTTYNPILLVLFFALGLRFAIHAHIFRHALSVSDLMGWVVSISLFLLLVLLQQEFLLVKN